VTWILPQSIPSLVFHLPKFSRQHENGWADSPGPSRPKSSRICSNSTKWPTGKKARQACFLPLGVSGQPSRFAPSPRRPTNAVIDIVTSDPRVGSYRRRHLAASFPSSSHHCSRQTELERGHQACERSSFMLTLFKTVAQVSQSASSTLLYFMSNGFLVAAVRSISCLAACSSLRATCVHTSARVFGICPNNS
jgi:hypothetical protein